MIETNYEQIENLCASSGMAIAASNLNIGREITYRDAPDRTIVIHFISADFPNVVRNTISAILELDNNWYFVYRYGSQSVSKFKSTENNAAIQLLLSEWPSVESEGNDIYLVGESGAIFISFDHHLIENGMPIYLSDINLAGKLLSLLNNLGAEFEAFSKHG